MPTLADSVRQLAAALTIAAIVITALVIGRDILIPVSLATVLAFILAPIVRWLTTWRIGHTAAVVLVITTMTLAMLAVSGSISAQMLSLTASLDSYKANVVEKLRIVTSAAQSNGLLSRAAGSIDSLKQAIEQQWSVSSPAAAASPSQDSQKVVVVSEGSGSVAGTYLRYLTGVLEPLAKFALTFLLTAFLLVQHYDLRDRVINVIGTDNLSETTAAFGEAGTRLSQLFLMVAVLNVSFGTFAGLALWIIGVPNALLWGIVTALMRFIPFIGSYLSALPPILLAAAVDPGWGMLIATAAVFAVGESVMGQIIEPLVLGRRAGVSPVAMVLAAAFWTLVWGPIGLLLAAPLTTVLVVVGRYVPGLEFVSVLLGDEPALSPQHEFYHRLLSEDPSSAAEQLETARGDATIADVADQIAFPALRLAATDQRRGRLDKEQVAKFRSTVTEMLELLSPIVKSESTSIKSDTRANILLLPARGEMDVVATEIAAALIHDTTQRQCSTSAHASGLTAIADARAQVSAAQTESIVIVSVSGMERQHLRLVARRATRDFPDAHLILLDWGRPQEYAVTLKNELGQGVMIFSTFSDLLATLKYRRESPPDSARDLSPEVRVASHQT